MKQRRFVIGDIHGAYKALIQVLEASKFDYKKDLLISLGDVADGWSQVPECFEELLKIKNLIYIMGNHDNWLYQWFKFGSSPYIWTAQGGQATINAYLRHYVEDSERNGVEMAHRHEELLSKALYYYELDRMLFVHGGYDWHYSIKDQLPGDLMWDRHLYETAIMWHKYNLIHPKEKQNIVEEYEKIFIGHTTTSYTDKEMKPVKVTNVINLDQGAGWEGKLTLMDIDTEKYWQSDLVYSLYPKEKGRR